MTNTALHLIEQHCTAQHCLAAAGAWPTLRVLPLLRCSCRAAGALVESFTAAAVTVRLTAPDATTVFDSLSVTVCEAATPQTCKDAGVCTPTEANTPCTVTVSGLAAATDYTASTSALEGTVNSVVGTPTPFTTRYS
jgi:hypothetical protein